MLREVALFAGPSDQRKDAFSFLAETKELWKAEELPPYSSLAVSFRFITRCVIEVNSLREWVTVNANLSNILQERDARPG